MAPHALTAQRPLDKTLWQYSGRYLGELDQKNQCFVGVRYASITHNNISVIFCANTMVGLQAMHTMVEGYENFDCQVLF